MEPNDIKRFTAYPGRSIETALLIERMKDGKPGDILTDTILTELIHKPTAPHEAGYSALQSAIVYLEKEGVIWRRLFNEKCVKCLEPTEKTIQAHNYRRSIGRRAKRSLRVLGSIDREKDISTDNERREHDALVHAFGVHALFCTPSMVKQLADRKASMMPDKTRFLELFNDTKIG